MQILRSLSPVRNLNPDLSANSAREMPRLILEDSFRELNGRNFKHMAPLWAQKWYLLLPTYLFLRSETKSLAQAQSNHSAPLVWER